MITVGEIRKVIEGISDDCVVMLCEAEPTSDDNSGVPIVKVVHDCGHSDPGDLGILYVMV